MVIEGSAVRSQMGTVFLGFLNLASFGNDALRRMGVDMEWTWVLNRPGALCFLRCIVYMKDVLTKSVFSSLDSSASSDQTVNICGMKAT